MGVRVKGGWGMSQVRVSVIYKFNCLHQFWKMFWAVEAVQCILSGSVMKVSWGISNRNGKCVAMVLLINFKFCCCVCERRVEKLIMGKYMCALGKVMEACFWS